LKRRQATWVRQGVRALVCSSTKAELAEPQLCWTKVGCWSRRPGSTYASSYSWLILTVSCSETLPVVLDGGDKPPGDRDDQRQELDPRADQYSKPARIEQVAQRAACEEPDEQKQPRERADNRDPPPRQ